MNSLEARLKELDPFLWGKLHETVGEVELLLGQYIKNFPTYTDHSISHTREVFNLAADLLRPSEIYNLNSDELYILSVACYLHDIGMCIPEEKINLIKDSEEFILHKKSNPRLSSEEYIRDIHHLLSNKFIVSEWERLKIVNLNYAKAIGIVAQGHRKVELDNTTIYNPKYFVKSGRHFVCLPYLSCVLRIADELDITCIRTPYLLTKYYMPNNDNSIREWKKHIATTQVNFTEDYTSFKVKCSDHQIFAALEYQFEKIQGTINYCQKVIRTIGNTEDRKFNLTLAKVVPEYEFIGFDPKGIRYSFNVQNVIQAFIGEDLYGDELTSIREAIQNSVDSCKYKLSSIRQAYTPIIKVEVTDRYIKIEDNGLGMDEFIVENFFGRLASSFYEQEKVKSEFEAIGQFGVGVFSYFLLSDYIDIETKTENSTALRFRIDKDPKNYFHFFDTTVRKEPGTTVTLYFKEAYIGKFNFNTIEKYISKIFRYVDVPIKINAADGEALITNRSFALDQVEETKKRLRLHYKKDWENFQLISARIKTEEYEGECGVLIEKLTPSFRLSMQKDYFDYDAFKSVYSRHNYSEVSISQKGVFVNNFPSCTIPNFIGSVNFLKKQKINIDRTNFRDRDEVNKVIFQFELKILNELLSQFNSQYPLNVQGEIFDNFLGRFFTPYEIPKEEFDQLFEILSAKVIVRISSNKEISLIPIKNLEHVGEFLLVTEGEKIAETITTLKIPMLICSGAGYYGSYSVLRRILTLMGNFIPSVLIVEGKGYLKLRKGTAKSSFEESKLINEAVGFARDIVEIESEVFMTSIWENKGLREEEYISYEPVFNLRHPFCQFIVSNYRRINQEKDLRKILKSAFDYILEVRIEGKVADSNISELNDLIKPLSVLGNLHKFTSRDFN